MKWWHWLLVVAGGASLGIATTPMPPPPESEDDMSPKQRLYAMLKALPQLTEDQRLFVMLVAYGETGATFRSTAHNDTPSEVAASVNAWNNSPALAAKLEACGKGGRDAWAIGSGGYGGRLVPYFGDDMLDAGLPCAPRGVFDPALSLVSTILTAWKLQQTKAWGRSAKTVANLRVGYYGLAYIDDVPQDRRDKYIRHAEAVGVGASFVDRVLTEFPGPSKSREIYSLLTTRAA